MSMDAHLNNMTYIDSEIISNRQIADDYFELVFTWNGPTPRAGHFLTLRYGDSISPLLRRPFAFSSFNAENGHGAIIYQKRGEATIKLAAAQTGEKINLIGPLGNHFDIFAETDETPVLVAGGIGVGPIAFLAEELVKAGKEPLVIIGGRTTAIIPEIRIPGAKIVYCTDDGSKGFAGNTVEYVRNMKIAEDKGVTFYSCGPEPMLKALSLHAAENGCKSIVSMEQYMACAVGACMGCVIKVKGDKPYARVCAEGPIFDAGIIEWT